MADGTHVDLGQALITMVEPTRDPERLREYNRWYEHDHALAGVMIGPGAFSYRRFVATRDLKALRAPGDAAGTFIALYWLLDGSVDEHYAWSFPQTQELAAAGRMNPDREHVSTSLYDYAGAANRAGWPVPPEIALDHPYGGLVVTWLDRAPDTTLDAVVAWARDEWVPTVLGAGDRIGQALVFTPRDFPGVPGTGVGIGEKVCVAWFLHDDPRLDWPAVSVAIADPVADAGVATLAFCGPFVPVVPGTATHLDQLW